MTSITAIVPATDRPPSLGRCLDALIGCDEPPDEVIVQRDPDGAGPAQARNLAARRASGDVVLFVDSDVVVHPDAVGRVRAAFDRDSGLTALFGAYDDRPEATGRVSRFRNLLHHHVHSSGAGAASTFWAGLGAVRRDAFLASGGFDADRFRRPAVEDVELGMRLHAAGARIELDPAIRGKHLKAWSLRSLARTDFTHRALPWLILLIEHRTSTRVLNLGNRHRLSALASLALVGFSLARRPRPALASAASLVALNGSFYALLARRGGPSLALAGLPLHCLHHLLSAAAVPVAVAIAAGANLRRRLRAPGRRGRPVPATEGSGR